MGVQLSKSKDNSAKQSLNRLNCTADALFLEVDTDADVEGLPFDVDDFSSS